ncbi:hypothetical protein GGI25_000808 [Coemansia spiralis]|uniref:Uncharacterized protein n=2 Tax=Coemansia TaxID=4863 RepID=A0A9W8L0M3_9FUNG|nr:hypothetical protein BX070DRAFT_121493 [Coemansia spiralis]KAJ1988415.1 hypothetical protein EDC05_005295 [Coemansia umbellata]KAJ2621070.1 hypothetical protein GGI26_004414 [Coemansia sp. RSA 1358]KAJ2680215.1 hypothetical protein GGI25_000808 [Coemansia spiralis]
MGAVPQFLVADALALCAPEQLEVIEHWNPHFIADNEPLWMAHCTQKYKARRELQENISSGTAGPVPSWRMLYRDMKRQDEIRAHEIMERVRHKTAAMERERNSRKIQITRAPLREPRGGRAQRHGKAQPKDAAAPLLQRARLETKAHISMLCGTRSSQQQHAPARRPEAPLPHRHHQQSSRAVLTPEAPSQPNLDSIQQQYVHVAASLRGPAAHGSQLSPAGSPAQSPPYSAYSPPYFSSASSCSPTYSAYSPPHVPELAANDSSSGCEVTPGFNIFEDMFGVSAASACSNLPPTVVIREQTRKRRSAKPPAKRKRQDSSSHLPDTFAGDAC